MSHALKNLARIVGVAGIALVLAAPGTATERVYDRDVKKLIDQACDQLDRFSGEMSHKAKGAKVTRDGVQTDISDFMKDFKTDGGRLRDRFGDSGVAAPEVLSFLRRGKSTDGFVERHPGFTGADSEWANLRRTLVKLADAYGIDWSSDPDSWRPRRMSDSELSTLAGGLDAQIRGAGKALGKAAKDAQVPSAERKELDASVNSLRDASKSLRKEVNSRAPASSLDNVLAQAKALTDRAASLGLSDAAGSALKPLQSSLGKLAAGFGRDSVF